MPRTFPKPDLKRTESFLQQASAGQFSLDFTPGLLEQFPRWQDVVRASVYGCGLAFKVIADRLDMTVSELSRKLANNPNDNVHFPLDRLDELIEATGDDRPVRWLVLRFLQDPESKRRNTLATIEALAPVLQQAMAALAAESK